MESLKPHIQFLRAISVLLVFFYHLKIDLFNFGYLGVDIFFVISGYVITSRLYGELLKNNNINFTSFYIRRFKRIFPVLIFILSSTLLFIIFFQPLDLFLNNFKVFIFTIFGVSNLYYLFSKKDYFDNVFEDALGHTWSLGVEEQFYLFFPIFLFVIYKLFRQKEVQILIITIFIFFGFYLTHLYSENFQLIFYSPLFRFWEFLLGCLAFLITYKINKKNSLISIICFCVLITFVIINFGFNNLYSVFLSTFLASMFLIFYEKKNKISWIFENKFFIIIGNISYSFYLWHLPIIYFYNLFFIDNLFRIPFIFILTFILSYFSYYFIENKFRYKKFNFKPSLLRKTVFGSIIFISFTLYILNISLQNSNQNLFKEKVKKIILNLNFLKNKVNYIEIVVFYKIKLDKNEIYRYCTKDSKEYNLNLNNLRIECLKEGKSRNRLFYIQGNFILQIIFLYLII